MTESNISVGNISDGVHGSNIAQNVYQTFNYGTSQPHLADPAELATAQNLLSGLPLDAIPAVAPLPPGSRMPFSPNPLFVGRQNDLLTLAQTLKGGGTTAINQVAAATGLGGLGKTQLAIEFVHRYGQFFAGGVFWLSFAESGTIPAEVAQCGGVGALHLTPDFEQLDLPTQVQWVLSAWQSALPRLLVFDNCEQEELLSQWKPPTGGCRVLVTSRRREWEAGLGVQPHPLGVLSRSESMTLLLKFRPDLAETDPNLAAIAAELGDLPLALHLAGSFLARYRHVVTPATYLAQLKDKALLGHPSLQGRWMNVSPTRHDWDVGRTFALSYDRLDPDDPADALARALLARPSILPWVNPFPATCWS